MPGVVETPQPTIRSPGNTCDTAVPISTRESTRLRRDIRDLPVEPSVDRLLEGHDTAPEAEDQDKDPGEKSGVEVQAEQKLAHQQSSVRPFGCSAACGRPPAASSGAMLSNPI